MPGEVFKKLLETNQADPATGREDVWRSLIARSAQAPVFSNLTEIAYQKQYFSENFPVHDFSLIIKREGRPVGAAVLLFQQAPAGASLKTLFHPVMMPVWDRELSVKSQKALGKIYIDSVLDAARSLGLPGVEFRFVANDEGQMECYRHALDAGGSVRLGHEMIVDLTLPLETIKSRMRESYRALINKGRRLWKIQTFDGRQDALISEFMDFHFRVAGRRTRSETTWQLNGEAMAQGEGLAVALRDEKDVLVGAGLFTHSRDESYYAVGIYERELFKLPLGHVVQYAAIEALQQRGVKRHVLGFRAYPQDVPAPTEKDLHIGKFKEGFMTSLVLSPIVTMKVNPS